MITPYIYAFLSVLLVSAISFVGMLALSFREAFLKKYIFIFISVAVGALLGDAFIHLIPESLENTSSPLSASVLIIAGILLFFVVEKFLHWHHHGEDENHSKTHPVGKLILLSDGVHNIMDGFIIGVSFLASIPLGIATAIAVVLHEIPQEVGDFTVLLHAGYKAKRALWLNFLSALSAVLGVVIAFFLGQSGGDFVAWVLPFAAGGFIYIAIADLIPELHKMKDKKYHSFLQIFSVVLGVLAMLALIFLE